MPQSLEQLVDMYGLEHLWDFVDTIIDNLNSSSEDISKAFLEISITKGLVNGIWTLIYPVGSIYMSVNDTSPQVLFGGIWERMSGGFLYGAVNFVGNGNGTGTITNGAIGDTGITTLTVEQIPSHNHTIDKDYGFFYHSKSISQWELINNSNGGVQRGSAISNNTGGSKGHTHTLNSHTHDIPYIAVYMWKRTN